MRGHVEYDIFEFPVDGHFRGMGRRPGFDFPGHHGPGFGPFWGHGFDHSPERFRHGHGGPGCGRRGPPHCGCEDHSPIRHGDHGPDHGHDGSRCRRESPNRGCDEHSPVRHEGRHGPEHHRRGPPEDGHRGPGCRHHGSPHRGCEDHSPARNGPDHDECGPPKHGHRGPHCGRSKSPGPCGRPSDRHCFGPPGGSYSPGPHGPGPHRPWSKHGPGPHGPWSRHGPGPHGPWSRHSPDRHWFGRHGPSEFPEHPCGGPWKGPWGFDHHRPGFGRHGPWRHGFGPRPCPYNIPEGRPSRNADCEKCCENEPCCSKNKGNRGRDGGRKENGPWRQRNKEHNPTGDTVFVQRIVLENAPRPQSV